MYMDINININALVNGWSNCYLVLGYTIAQTLGAISIKV